MVRATAKCAAAASAHSDSLTKVTSRVVINLSRSCRDIRQNGSPATSRILYGASSGIMTALPMKVRRRRQRTLRPVRRTNEPHRTRRAETANAIPSPCKVTVASANPAMRASPPVSATSDPWAWPCSSAKAPTTAAPGTTGRSTATTTKSQKHNHHLRNSPNRVSSSMRRAPKALNCTRVKTA